MRVKFPSGVAILVVSLVAVAAPRMSFAAVIYYEGFDYGAADTDLAGQNGGTGFSGPWVAGNPGITYAAAGLSFSDLSVHGGSMTATGNDGIGNALCYRPLTSTLNGVYYGSFLTRVVNASQFAISNGMSLAPQNTPPGHGTTAGFGILSPANADALLVNQGNPFTSNGSTLIVGQTYLALFRINTTAKSITGWLLSAAQYDNFKRGGITEDELNAAPVGTASNNVWARASVTGNDLVPVTASYLNVYLDAFGGVSATLAEDEFRLSDTSLAEVTPAQPGPGSATWRTSPVSGDWNTASNWKPQVVPNGQTATATFGVSNITDVSLSANTEVNGIVFNPGASEFTISGEASPSFNLIVSGAGITNNSAVTQNFAGYFSFINSATAGNGNIFTLNGSGKGGVTFADTATAGSSTFIVNGGTIMSTGGAVAKFVSSASADGAIIIANGSAASGATAGAVQFWDTSTAGNASLIANDQAGGGYGGRIEFFDKSHGGTARVEVFGAGSLHVELYSPRKSDVTVGSIEGDGKIFIAGSQGSKNLIVGSNNLDTTFSGQILGTSSSGYLTKIGTGTLSLTGANSEYGATFIRRGTLLVNNLTGSGTGNGGVFVDAGTLGGNGSISGGVVVGDESGHGAFLAPGVGRPSTSTLKVGNLVFYSDATYKVELNSTRVKADKVVTPGVTINSGAQFSFSDIGNSTLAPGTTFTIIRNTGPAPIFGTFNNLPDGATFNSNGNTFRANYEGGDGNDLTLTVQ